MVVGPQHARLFPRHHVGQCPAGHGGQSGQDAAEQEDRTDQEQQRQGRPVEEAE